MSGTITFTVPGTPIPEGSTRYAGHRAGKPVLVHDNPKLHAWRQAVGLVAKNACLRAGWVLPLDEPVLIAATFYLHRPQRPRFAEAATKPDLDKLTRAVGDALTSSVLFEDSRIISWQVSKKYAGEKHPEGAEITIVRQGINF